MNISFFLKPKVEVSYLTESCPVQKAIETCSTAASQRFLW